MPMMTARVEHRGCMPFKSAINESRGSFRNTPHLRPEPVISYRPRHCAFYSDLCSTVRRCDDLPTIANMDCRGNVATCIVTQYGTA
jgi:hypothetical protein